MTKLGVTAPVGNHPFHPQWFSSFPSANEQVRHSLIILCTPWCTGPV